MSLSLKPGVSLLGLSMQMVVALLIIEGCYSEYGRDCVITSATDGKHGAHSHHLKGCAVDLRTTGIPTETMGLIVVMIRERLSGEFQVVLEDDHLHVEFDPA